MKFCALLIIVAAVCAMLPSHAGGAVSKRRLVAWGHEYSDLAQRSLLRQVPLAVAKRVAARQTDDATLTSEEVDALLMKYGITMEELDDNINNDPEIEPEEREEIKALVIDIISAFGDQLSALDDDDLDMLGDTLALLVDSSEEVE